MVRGLYEGGVLNLFRQDAWALILTEWPEFTRANWTSLINLMNGPRVVDARNVLDPKEMVELGYLYDDLGRI